MALQTGEFLREYKFKMTIENSLTDELRFGVGPMAILDDKGKARTGFIYSGAVSVFDGPFGPVEMVMGDTKGEPSALLTLKPKATIEPVRLIVKAPEDTKPSEFRIVIGRYQPRILRFRFK
jgi:hypothetical protein